MFNGRSSGFLFVTKGSEFSQNLLKSPRLKASVPLFRLPTVCLIKNLSLFFRLCNVMIQIRVIQFLQEECAPRNHMTNGLVVTENNHSSVLHLAINPGSQKPYVQKFLSTHPIPLFSAAEASPKNSMSSASKMFLKSTNGRHMLSLSLFRNANHILQSDFISASTRT